MPTVILLTFLSMTQFRSSAWLKRKETKNQLLRLLPCRVRVSCRRVVPYIPSSPALGVLVLKTTLFNVIPDDIHSFHYCSSCSAAPNLQLHRPRHLSSFVHPQNVFIAPQHGLYPNQRDAFPFPNVSSFRCIFGVLLFF